MAKTTTVPAASFKALCLELMDPIPGEWFTDPFLNPRPRSRARR